MAKQASLAAQSGALAQSMELPAVFSAPPEPLKAREWGPYVVFAHNQRKDEWAKILRNYPQAQDGDMFFIDNDAVVKLDVAKLGLICAKQYWVKKDAAGNMVHASFTELPKYNEHVQTVVLVYFDDKVVPANLEFRTTKCGGAKTLSDALIEAASLDWAEKSPAHKETLVCAQPFMRFYGELSLLPQRTSKTSGMLYKPTTCKISPTTVAEWRLLNDLVNSDEAKKQLKMAAETYERRLNEVKAKA